MFGLNVFSAIMENARGLCEEIAAMRKFFSEANRRIKGEEDPIQMLSVEEDKRVAKTKAKVG